MVRFGVFLVADPDAGDLEQAHDCGKNFFPRQTGATQIALDVLAQRRQGRTELEHAGELAFVTQRSPFGVVAVLLAPAGITRRSLEMGIGNGRDPDIGPCRRQHHFSYPGERCFVGYHSPIGIRVFELPRQAEAENAGA